MHRMGAQDMQRSAMFSKLSRERSYRHTAAFPVPHLEFRIPTSIQGHAS